MYETININEFFALRKSKAEDVAEMQKFLSDPDVTNYYGDVNPTEEYILSFIKWKIISL